MGNFDFLENYEQFRLFSGAAIEAERAFAISPSMCVIGCRRALELAVKWTYNADTTLRKPAGDAGLGYLINSQEFRKLVPNSIHRKMRFVNRFGNDALQSSRAIKPDEAMDCLRTLFQFVKWIDCSYGTEYIESREFSSDNVPIASTITDVQRTRRVQHLVPEDTRAVEQLCEKVAAKSEDYTAMRVGNSSKRRYDPSELSEFETRKMYIDADLESFGWILDGPNADVEFEYHVNDMCGVEGNSGSVDYVLFGDSGLPLAVVEAKRTCKDPNTGRVQAGLYADCLEHKFGCRPMMFTTNGFETYFWDDVSYPQRRVSSIFSRADLQRLMYRRTQSKKPSSIPINQRITDRYYQLDAIRAVCRDIENKIRKHLVVMATGTGKTRTTVSLVDVLTRSGHVKNVLFLADRLILVEQAHEAFREHLPNTTVCNLCKNKGAKDSAIVVSTYPTIFNCIVESRGENNGVFFSPAHFDLIIADESHRSIFNKYKSIFEYFDAQVLGLTATPKTDIDRDTYRFFDKDPESPTYAYDYKVALSDGFLVPYHNIEVELKFLSQGITYSELSDSDKQRYEEDFESDGDTPTYIPSEEIDRFIFNKDTVDKVLTDLMKRGIRADGDEHLGKTIIFASNKLHAEFILERFNALFPQYNGKFAKRVVCDDSYAEQTIREFREGRSMNPQIIVSVDMMDTGVDVLDCVNLVFFKRVHSVTKFWQMIGRGTRIFNGGAFVDYIDGAYFGKRRFLIFDYCGNFEEFRVDMMGRDSGRVTSLHQRIFQNCVRIIHGLQASEFVDKPFQDFRSDIVDLCHEQVTELVDERPDVFVKRKFVEKFRNESAFVCLSESDKSDLIDEISPLVGYPPASVRSKNKDKDRAIQFDSLMFAIIASSIEGRSFSTQVSHVQSSMRMLERKTTIQEVKKKLPTIRAVLDDRFWNSGSILEFERVRTELRSLMNYLDEKDYHRIVYTDLQDAVLKSSEGKEIQSPYDFEEYHSKVDSYLNQHKNDEASPVYKIYHNIPLADEDVNEIYRIMQELGTQDQYRQAYGDENIGRMIRTVVKMDHDAIMEAFSSLVNELGLNKSQTSFIHRIMEHIEKVGFIEPKNLFEVPFDRPEPFFQAFSDEIQERIVSIIEEMNRNAQIPSRDVATGSS